jgi:hypothetical protein
MQKSNFKKTFETQNLYLSDKNKKEKKFAKIQSAFRAESAL